MEIADWEIIRLELKYCERCGGLWLRQRGTGRVYCAACSSDVPNFPLCGRRISRPRMPTNRKLTFEGPDESMRFIIRDGEGHA